MSGNIKYEKVKIEYINKPNKKIFLINIKSFKLLKPSKLNGISKII